MKYLVNAKQMKMIDEETIEKIGIPSMVLMERAALSVVHEISKRVDKSDKILCICGTGNNGGDGIAIARLLKQAGYQADILLLKREDIKSQQTIMQIKIAENLDVNIFNNMGLTEYTVIVDAIFGIGLSKKITGVYEDIINEINKRELRVFSVDIPSGISADSGQILGCAVRADYTITFGVIKIGLMVYPGAFHAGEIILADIGFPESVIAHIRPNYFIYDPTELEFLPKRVNDSNKGTYGRILIIAGSHNMSGACYLSGKAAYRSGAGLVKILTVASNRIIIQTGLPEAILATYDPDQVHNKVESDNILREILWADAIVIGPGIGLSSSSAYILEMVLKHAKVPTLIDADGLNLLSGNSDYRVQRKDNTQQFDLVLPSNVIITPHLKEMERLTGMQIEDMKKNLPNTACMMVGNERFQLVLKDARTIVTNGKKVYINVSGNNGMSTAGSGDVLTGIIIAFAAQGMSLYDASVLGVYVHGLAGNEALKLKGSYSMIAEDILEALPEVLK